MESSDGTSSDHDSSSSSDASLMYQPTTATMHAHERSEAEKKMIDGAITSLLDTFDHFRPQLSQAQYAYFCEFGTKYLNGVMDKKTRKLNRSFMDSTKQTKSDLLSEAGSVRHGSSGPLYQCYPSNIPSAQRPPIATSSVIRDYPSQPAFEPLAHRFMQSGGHSSGSRQDSSWSGVQSHGMESHYNKTGISEAYNAQSLRRQPPVSRIQGGRELRVIEETPASPSSQGINEDHSTDETVREITMRLAVPKRPNGVVELKNWGLKLVKEDLVVTGTTGNRVQVTSGAVKRYSQPTITTSDGSYQVFGKPTFGDRIPAFVKSACGNGFPRWWKSLSLKWLSERQSRNRLSPESQSDKENKTAKRRSRSLDSSPVNRGKSTHGKKNVLAKKSEAKKRPLTSDEGESAEETSSPEPKQSKTNVKSRSNPKEESDSDSPAVAKQRQGPVKSRNNEETLTMANKKKPSNAIKQPTAGPSNPLATKETVAIPKQLSAKQQKKAADKQEDKKSKVKQEDKKGNAKQEDKKGKVKQEDKKGKAKQEDKKGKTNQEDKKGKVKQEDTKGKAKQEDKKGKTNQEDKKGKATKSQGTSKKTGGSIFGDSPVGSAAYEDAFAELGGDHLFSIPYSRSMTPNTLVASIQPDEGTIGRYTPPIQNVQHLFPTLRPNQTFNSSYGSPSSFNSSRDNHVSRRVAKDVAEASKKVGKKKKKLPVMEEAPRELADLVKSLNNPNPGFRTPTIVKKVFRNQRGSEEDESESEGEEEEESMAY